MKLVKRYRFFPICMVLLAWGCGSERSVAHEFEDGIIERSVKLVAFQDRLVIEYSVGLNPNTMLQQLEAWKVAVPVEVRQAHEEAERALENGGAPTRDQSGQAPLETLFRESVAERLKRQLEVKLDGQDVELKWASTDISPVHHVNMIVQFEAGLSGSGARQLVCQDCNFLDSPGGTRYALKSRGEVLVRSSNVEPSLIRAERVDLGKIRADARKKYTRVQATLLLPK